MLKVGLVGYGFMGHMHTQCHEATGEAKIVAVADVDPAKRDEAKAKYGCEVFASIEEMLAGAELDIVDITTPTYLHEECVIAAAKAGKDILCEKPMAMTLESCDRMIEAAKKTGVKMMIGQCIRFWPEYVIVKDLVDSGELGAIQWVSASRRSPIPTWAWEGWLFDAAKSGGGLHDLHIHDLDFFIYLLGAPKKVFARGITSATGGIDSVMTTSWGHDKGVASYAEGALDLSPTFPFNMSLVVACEKATIKLDSGADPSLMVYPNEGEPYAPKLPEQTVSVSTETSGNLSSLGGYFNEIQYFIECVKADKHPETVTPGTGREAVRFSLAARKSAETNEIVDF